MKALLRLYEGALKVPDNSSLRAEGVFVELALDFSGADTVACLLLRQYLYFCTRKVLVKQGADPVACLGLRQHTEGSIKAS
jgi:hypothetical protein